MMITPFTRHTLQFQPIDPLGDGLGYDIAKEQTEPQAIEFQQDLDGDSLAAFWDKLEMDMKNDPQECNFSDD